MKFIPTSLIGSLQIVAALGIFSQTTLSAETVVVKEDFANAVQNEDSNAIDSAISWNAFCSRGGKIPWVKEAVESASSGKALEFSGQSQNALLVGAFPPVELKKAGDSIALTVSYRYLHQPTNPAPGFVIGLLNSNGMPLNAGKIDFPFRQAPEVGVDHQGYRVGKNPNTDVEDIVLDKTVGASSGFPYQELARVNSGVVLTDRKPHVLKLKITRQPDNTLALAYEFDGTEFTFAADSSSVVTPDFDSIFIQPLARDFGESNGNNYIQLLDVTVTHNES